MTQAKAPIEKIQGEKTQVEKRKKFWTQIIGGFIFGFTITLIFSFFFEDMWDSLPELSSDALLLNVIGLVYALMGLVCGLGLVLPKKLAVQMLNIEDEEELDEQRRILTGSSIVMLAIGISLCLLALSGDSGIISPIVAFSGVIISTFACIFITLKDWKLYDELLRQMSLETTYLSLSITAMILWFWCSAAWIGWILLPSPLIIISLISGLYIISVFIICGRRGLLIRG